MPLIKYRHLIALLLALAPALTAFTPLQSSGILPGWWRWWIWLIIFLVGIVVLMWLLIRAAWSDVPAPPPPAERVAEAEPAETTATAAPAPAAQSAPVAEAEPAVDVDSIPKPVLVDISDDMDPADVRKARIANAKAQAEYKKALKAAGVDLSAANSGGNGRSQPSPQPAAPAEPEPAPAQTTTAADMDSIPQPDLIEITDDMDPSDVRQARIANAKAQAEYKKALKAAGIDPASVGSGGGGGGQAATPKKEPDAPEPTGARETAEAAAALSSVDEPPQPDDLEKIEGIGPEIAVLLSEAGIHSFAQLAEADPDRIREIVSDAGSRYQLADLTNWNQQAALAAAHNWDELSAMQAKLQDGRDA